MYRHIFKGLIDVVGALVLLVLFSPILLILLIVLLIHYKGKPFFLQQRMGYKDQPFFIYKFKTMIDAYDEEGNRLPDHLRITKIGKFLRKTSLDELPQFINIVKRDMSFIGPRPLSVRYLPYYTERERRRHTVLPGITGLSQVSGRNNLPWDERLELDVVYVEKLSFLLDCKIGWKTVLKVAKREDITITPQMDSLIVSRGGVQPKTKKGSGY